MVDHRRKSLGYRGGELLGLPGVGKSWVSHNGSDAIPETAQRILVPQGWSIGKMANVLTGIWVGRGIISSLINLLVTNSTGSMRRRARSALLVFERLGRQERENNPNIQLIRDEGVLQSLWGLVLHLPTGEKNREALDKLFCRAVKSIGPVYYVSCPRNMHVDRMGMSSASTANASGTESLLRRDRMVFVLRQLRKLGVKVFTVKNSRRRTKDMDMKQPFVSVVIPMRNEAAYIQNCLRSLLDNDYPGESLEILVVDGVSNDGSCDIVSELADRNPNIRLLRNPERITPTALNIGIDNAKGDVIVRMDVHAIYPIDYISKCVAGLFEYGADNVGGMWNIQAGADTYVAKAIASAQSHPVGVGNVAYRIGSKGVKWVDTVPYGCYKKEVLQRLGGFDPELIRNQDDELNARLRKAGGKILLDPSIQCTYFARPTLVQVGRMFYQYGYFKPLAARKIGKAYSIRQLVPPAFVALVMILGLGAVFSHLIFWLFLMLLATYLAVILSAAVTIGLGVGIGVAFWLPMVFAVMHFTYGAGSLRGVIDFLIRKKVPRDVRLTR